MKTILVLNSYSQTVIRLIKKYVPDGFELMFLEESSQQALERQVGNADYILAGGRLKLNKDVLDRADNLKMIQRSGVGLDALDLEAIKEKGIPLYVNRGVNSESVAEHALLLLLACLRRLPIVNSNTKNGIWKKQDQGVLTGELRGRTVGIIGMGNIATVLVGLLKPFHVNILYNNLTQVEREFESENNMKFVCLDELLANSDIVTIHCSLNQRTRNLINDESLAMMKDGAILVNTARGEIVDPVAVSNALKSGKLAYAGLDVHAKEPIPDDYPLKYDENVILTPHIAGVTADSFNAMMHDAFRNIKLFDQGQLEEIEPYRYL
ncbi:MAG: 2-hydroxyacid dehydrogenase [Clostridia bacterium]|nr:2-hydroxyacid dehydrogenase [Clostridia bacterium]